MYSSYTDIKNSITGVRHAQNVECNPILIYYPEKTVILHVVNEVMKSLFFFERAYIYCVTSGLHARHYTDYTNAHDLL